MTGFKALIICSRALGNGRAGLTTDPRDKVFALLGPCSNSSTIGIKADYTKPCAMVYAEVTFVLLQAGFYDVLRYNDYKDSEGLPSWVPDRVHTGLREIQRDREPFSASANKAMSWRKDPTRPGVLLVDGVMVDPICSSLAIRIFGILCDQG